ncbi:MAG: ABC transporter permease [Nitrososphaerota archaeon]|nr:ABC transporter permease [Nitrososphaerota archaeon]
MELRRTKEFLKQLFHYKSALIGSLIILSLVILSIYTIIALPYNDAVELWRAGEKYWLDNPRNALPSWVNIFSSKKLPETITLNTEKPQTGVSKVIIPTIGKVSVVKIEFTFKYEYDDFPSELNLFIKSNFNSSPPRLTVHWIKPNGEDIILKTLQISSQDENYYISIDHGLMNELKKRVLQKLNKTGEYDIPVILSLFAIEDESILNHDTAKVMKGTYKLWIDGLIFEANANIDAKLNVYGKVYGWAGTDHLRRDIGIAILWGTPVSLAFGITAAVIIAFVNILLGAVSAWFGRHVDTIIQRITEIFMVIPFLPTMIMISMFFRFNLLNILLAIIALSIFGSGVKVYRATFLQVKEFPYVEAAKAYGAGSFRIIIRYLIPKVLPTIIPSIIISVPDFVFLEAVLSLLGIGDPLIPTWGKIIEDAFRYGALYKGLYYWVLEPSFMLAITSIGFALLGFTLDRIFNPRLKEM